MLIKKLKIREIIFQMLENHRSVDKHRQYLKRTIYTASGLALLSLGLGANNVKAADNPVDQQTNADTTRVLSTAPASSSASANTQVASAVSATSQNTATLNESASITTNENLSAQNVKSATVQSNANTSAASAVVDTSDNTSSSTKLNANTAMPSARTYTAVAAVYPDTFTIGNRDFPRTDAVDVSNYQYWLTPSDYTTLKQRGVKTVIVKLTEGTWYQNPAAGAQIQNARNAGLGIAVYHFARFSSQESAVNEANYFINAMRRYGISTDTPVISDMESTEVNNRYGAGNLNAFWNTLRANGYSDDIVYTSLSFDQSYGFSSTVGKKKTWIAQYPYHPRASYLAHQDYGAWQFSSAGYINNKGAIDCSIDYASLFTPTSNLVEKNENGHWYLYKDGVRQTDFQHISDNRTVYYNNNGMVHGEAKINGQWYYFAANNGDMAKGLTRLPDGRHVYYNNNGQMVHGEANIGGHWYYFATNNGDMQTGFITLPDGRHVYYNGNGWMAHGEAKINGSWYHFAENNGQMSTGFTKLNDGRTVYYDANGRMQHGWVKLGNSYYYFATNNGDKFRGEHKINGYWYYFGNNGRMVTGFTTLPDGRHVYYDNNGRMLHGRHQINGNWYDFASNNGQIRLTKLSNGHYVYYDGNGRLYHGEAEIDGHWYYFGSNGQMSTGFVNLPDGRRVYYDNNGQMVHGERMMNGSWYHFAENNGQMSTSFTKLNDGRTVYYDDNGRMQHGWSKLGNSYYYFATNNGDKFRGEHKIDGYWYYFGNNGRMVTGFVTLPDGRRVYYDAQGRMVHGTRTINGRTYHFNIFNGAL